MTEKIAYWAAVLGSCVVLLMAITNAAMMKNNRAMQDEIGRRQMSIDAATRISTLNQNLAQALAESAVTRGDADIRDLLASQGITVHEKNEPKATDGAPKDTRKNAAKESARTSAKPTPKVSAHKGEDDE